MKKIITILLTIITFLSCNESDENFIKKETESQAWEWFTKNKSIKFGFNENEGKHFKKDTKSKKNWILINKIQLKIKSDKLWEYGYQKFNIAYLEPGKALLSIETIFTKTNKILKREVVFFFDILDSEISQLALPLTDKSQIIENGTFTNFSKEKKIWKGSFKPYLKMI